MPPKSGLEFATVERLVTVNPESSNPLFPPSYAYRRSDHPDFSGWSFLHQYPVHQKHSAMRSIWTGTLGFGLVNIPVKLYSAVQESHIDLDMLDKKTIVKSVSKG
ncbi:hypothetical protein MKQ70_27240 [Chitinophaga sedimenti]|uniref:hypothetical protein n=1 Tax=Chitinophaga sedimenti TaxID=2033606 RepID=UPI00200537E3|nr:hypothetical protein [Chitinophaga sedimenti]MCK7558490.1 hypothetical protein [Chitinophaga sedimenti]